MIRSELLEKANACVTGERPEDYGSPEDNFSTIAQLWAAYIKAACVAPSAHVDIGGKDVALMMALLKIARAISSQNPDNYIDLAGYAACAGEIATEDKDDIVFHCYTSTKDEEIDYF